MLSVTKKIITLAVRWAWCATCMVRTEQQKEKKSWICTKCGNEQKQ